MVTMGLKGVHISNLHADHIYLAHAHGEGLHLQEQGGGECRVCTPIACIYWPEVSPANSLLFWFPKSNPVVSAGYLSQDRSARIIAKVTIPIRHP